MNLISYHELGKISPEKAKEVVRKVFEKNEGNVSKTARVLVISRATVRSSVPGLCGRRMGFNGQCGEVQGGGGV